MIVGAVIGAMGRFEGAVIGWGVLGLGVVVLGVMAWRLLKQLGATSTDKIDMQ